MTTSFSTVHTPQNHTYTHVHTPNVCTACTLLTEASYKAASISALPTSPSFNSAHCLKIHLPFLVWAAEGSSLLRTPAGKMSRHLGAHLGDPQPHCCFSYPTGNSKWCGEEPDRWLALRLSVETPQDRCYSSEASQTVLTALGVLCSTETSFATTGDRAGAWCSGLVLTPIRTSATS